VSKWVQWGGVHSLMPLWKSWNSHSPGAYVSVQSKNGLSGSAKEKHTLLCPALLPWQRVFSFAKNLLIKDRAPGSIKEEEDVDFLEAKGAGAKQVGWGCAQRIVADIACMCTSMFQRGMQQLRPYTWVDRCTSAIPVHPLRTHARLSRTLPRAHLSRMLAPPVLALAPPSSRTAHALKPGTAPSSTLKRLPHDEVAHMHACTTCACTHAPLITQRVCTAAQPGPLQRPQAPAPQQGGTRAGHGQLSIRHSRRGCGGQQWGRERFGRHGQQWHW